MRKKREFLNYFGSMEKKPLAFLAARRDEMLRGWSAWFMARNIMAKHLTLLSFILMLAFFPLFFRLKWWPAALLTVLAHIMLDALDGPLARHSETASQSGALADMLNDISGMAIVGLTLIFLGNESNPGLVATYIVVYLYLTIFVVVLNLTGTQLPWIIRTKYFLFLFVFMKYWFEIDVLQIFLAVSIIYMAAHSAFAVIRLFRRLDEIEAEEDALADGEKSSSGVARNGAAEIE